MTTAMDTTNLHLRAPRAAAVAGILFALLLTTSLVMIWSAIPSDPSAVVRELESNVTLVNIALFLVPFAGVAFLWFIGVIRDRIGIREDKLFSSLYLGSGILFLAMYFTCSAIAGAQIFMVRMKGPAFIQTDVYLFGRQSVYLLMNVYAMKMAAMFMMSTSGVSLRTGVLPKWLSILGAIMALAIIIGGGIDRMFVLFFPAWVFVLSIVVLIGNLKGDDAATSTLNSPTL